MATDRPRYSLPTSAPDLARRTTVGVGIAVAAVLVAQALVDAFAVDVGGDGAMSPFAAGPLVGTTVVAGAAAAVVYAGVIRFTDRPMRNFLLLAGVAFALQLVPVVAFAPSLDVTPLGQAVLVAYHVLVAVPLVVSLLGAFPR